MGFNDTHNYFTSIYSTCKKPIQHSLCLMCVSLHCVFCVCPFTVSFVCVPSLCCICVSVCITLQVEREKAVIIQGPRGSGKTSIVKGIAEYFKVRNLTSLVFSGAPCPSHTLIIHMCIDMLPSSFLLSLSSSQPAPLLHVQCTCSNHISP